jgi:hypothetical protein
MYALESNLNIEVFIRRVSWQCTAMYRSSDCCKGDGNGMVLSESRVEGGWLLDQRGVLGLDDDTVVT